VYHERGGGGGEGSSMRNPLPLSSPCRRDSAASRQETQELRMGTWRKQRVTEEAWGRSHCHPSALSPATLLL